MKKLIEKDLAREFKRKVKADKKLRGSIKVFIEKYLPDYMYSRISLQLNRINALQPEVAKAIDKYLSN